MKIFASILSISIVLLFACDGQEQVVPSEEIPDTENPRNNDDLPLDTRNCSNSESDFICIDLNSKIKSALEKSPEESLQINSIQEKLSALELEVLETFVELLVLIKVGDYADFSRLLDVVTDTDLELFVKNNKRLLQIESIEDQEVALANFYNLVELSEEIRPAFVKYLLDIESIETYFYNLIQLPNMKSSNYQEYVLALHEVSKTVESISDSGERLAAFKCFEEFTQQKDLVVTRIKLEQILNESSALTLREQSPVKDLIYLVYQILKVIKYETADEKEKLYNVLQLKPLSDLAPTVEQIKPVFEIIVKNEGLSPSSEFFDDIDLDGIPNEEDTCKGYDDNNLPRFFKDSDQDSYKDDAVSIQICPHEVGVGHVAAELKPDLDSCLGDDDAKIIEVFRDADLDEIRDNTEILKHCPSSSLAGFVLAKGYDRGEDKCPMENDKLIAAYYPDTDDDGFHESETVSMQCPSAAGFYVAINASLGLDSCPNQDDSTKTTFFIDEDGDGVASSLTEYQFCSSTMNGYIQKQSYSGRIDLCPLDSSSVNKRQLKVDRDGDGLYVLEMACGNEAVYIETSDYNVDNDDTSDIRLETEWNALPRGNTYFTIATPAQWFDLAEACSESEDTSSCNAKVVLPLDLDFAVLDGSRFDSIPGDGKVTISDPDYLLGFNQQFFEGVIEGRTTNKTILKNLDIQIPTENRVGLIGSSRATVSGLSYTGSVTGKNSVGGIAGYVTSGTTISDVEMNGSVNGERHIGGLVGYLESGRITNSRNNAIVTGNSYVGGILGANFFQDELYSSISNAVNYGNVTASGSVVGGIVGSTTNSIYRSYNTGAITGKEQVGGIAGYVAAFTNVISDTYNTGTITAEAFLGGLIGRVARDNFDQVKTKIKWSYNLGNLVVIGNNLSAGWSVDPLVGGNLCFGTSTVLNVFYLHSSIQENSSYQIDFLCQEKNFNQLDDGVNPEVSRYTSGLSDVVASKALTSLANLNIASAGGDLSPGFWVMGGYCVDASTGKTEAECGGVANFTKVRPILVLDDGLMESVVQP